MQLCTVVYIWLYLWLSDEYKYKLRWQVREIFLYELLFLV